MKNHFRSGCAIASTLDIIGDKWSLLILRDILIHHKMTFKDFLSSEEKIAPSILSARLKLLLSFNLIAKHKQVDNQKENIYLLTKKGLDLSAILIDICLWGSEHLNEYNAINHIEGLDQDRSLVISIVKKNYQAKVKSLSLVE